MVKFIPHKPEHNLGLFLHPKKTSNALNAPMVARETPPRQAMKATPKAAMKVHPVKMHIGKKGKK